ncbi:MAG: O-antigen ligase family protein [Betaproteobacteria bacterium]
MPGRLNGWAVYVAVAIGFSIPISTALDSVLCAAVLLLWLAGGGYREKLQTIRDNPVALAALLFLAVTLIGLIWSVGPLDDRFTYLRKYSNVLLIPVFITLFSDPANQRRGLLAMALALAITVIGSFAVAADILPASRFITGMPSDPVVFKTRIAHNVLMAFGVVLFVVLARQARMARARWIWGGLSVAAFIDVLVIQGRTGYVVLPGLLTLLLFRTWRWKGLGLGLALIAIVLAVAYALPGNFQGRIDKAGAEAAQWRPDSPAKTSVGYRLEFYRNTVALIEQHPLFGVGTGGFKQAYADQVRGSTMDRTHNPHNLYLMVAAEFGLLGIAALAYLLITMWRCAEWLSLPGHALLAHSLVLTFVIAGAFNTLIIDHTESMLFAWMSGVLFAGFAQRKS